MHFPNLSFEAMEVHRFVLYVLRIEYVGGGEGPHTQIYTCTYKLLPLAQVDFGCILNDTETTKQLTMTNSSPLEVHYIWSFLKHPPARRVDPEQLDEGVDMQSEIETDSLEEQEEEEERVREEEGTGEVEGEDVEETFKVEREDKEQEVGDREKTGDEDKAKVQDINMEDSRAKGDESEVQQSSKETTLATISAPLPIKRVRRKRASKSKKCNGALERDPFTPISIEQVFDILPLHGALQPGQSEEVQFTFHGHTGIATEVMAVCRVEGGPAYRLRLMGESSVVQYKISRTHIEVGKQVSIIFYMFHSLTQVIRISQLYDQVLTADIVVQNRGKVAMDFTVSGAAHGSICTPGQIVVSQTTVSETAKLLFFVS